MPDMKTKDTVSEATADASAERRNAVRKRRHAHMPMTVVAGTVAAILLLVALATGCGRRQGRSPTGEVGGPANAAAKTELTLFTWTREDELGANQELVRKFEAVHPNLAVRIINVPGSYEAMAKLHTMVAGGQPPDIASIHGGFHLGFAQSGALANLGQVTAEDSSFDLKDFHPRLLDLCRWQGKLYSLPRYTSIYALYYNKDLFDAAGVPYPSKQGQWTWSQYLDTVRKLTLDQDGDGKTDQWGAYIDFWQARLYPWLWQNKASLLDVEKGVLTLNTPAAVEALQFLVDLRLKYKVTPPPTPGEKNEGLDLFTQGRAATYLSGPWDVGAVRERAKFAWDVWHLPQKKQRATMLGTENYALMAGSKHPQEAWELLKFLVSQKSQEFMAEKQEKMPSRVSVLNGAYVRAEVGYNRRVFVDALTYAQAPPNIPQWEKIQDLLQEELDLIWTGQKPVKQGLDDAVRKVNRALKELREGRQGK